eukprot:m.163533 g.163533  ORF g.163533 m.163533 type:complete len:757 (+) comp15219_c0_seq17:272-2542(+)
MAAVACIRRQEESLNPLTADLEIVVALGELFNLDLFERGYYALHVCTKLSTGTHVHIEPLNESNTHIEDQTIITDPVEVRFRRDLFKLGEGIVYKCTVNLDPHSSIETCLRSVTGVIVCQLWFHASSSNNLKKVDSQALTLAGVACPGVHHAGPVQFDFFHSALLTLSVSSCLVGFHINGSLSAYLTPPRESRMTWIPRNWWSQSSQIYQVSEEVSENESLKRLLDELKRALMASVLSLEEIITFTKLNNDKELTKKIANTKAFLPVSSEPESYDKTVVDMSSLVKGLWDSFTQLQNYDVSYSNLAHRSYLASRARHQMGYLFRKSPRDQLMSTAESRFDMLDLLIKSVQSCRSLSISDTKVSFVDNEDSLSKWKDLPLVFEECFTNDASNVTFDTQHQEEDTRELLDSIKETKYIPLEQTLGPSNHSPYHEHIRHGTVPLAPSDGSPTPEYLSLASLEKFGKGHLVVCVHGMDGNQYDLRSLKLKLLESLPLLEFFLPASLEGITHESLEHITDTFVAEFQSFLDAKSKGNSEQEGVTPFKRISFVGHSLGTIIIRSALERPEIKRMFEGLSNANTEPATKSNGTMSLHCFLSLCGPHLGSVYLNKLIGTGMWWLSRWKHSKSLKQLSLADSEEGFENSYLYKLSKSPALEQFKKVVFVASPQDKYVSISSALVQSCSEAQADLDIGPVYQKMAQNIISPLVKNESVSVHRTYLYVPPARRKGVNGLIGRSGHIAVLEDDLAVRMLVMGISRFFH